VADPAILPVKTTASPISSVRSSVPTNVIVSLAEKVVVISAIVNAASLLFDPVTVTVSPMTNPSVVQFPPSVRIIVSDPATVLLTTVNPFPCRLTPLSV